MLNDVNININQTQVAGLDRDAWVRDVLQQQGDEVASLARALAPVWPRGSRGGAASIHATTGEDANGYYVDVSWDAAHGYMRFPNAGTQYQEAQRFMERALNEALGGLL